MVYVKHFDILGIDTAQIPCIELQGPPNAATEGAVGLLGMDVTSDGREIYVCTAVNGAIYTWKSLKDGKDGLSVVKAEINGNGELIITLSDGNTLNAGVVKGSKGEDGIDGVDGENGADGISITNTQINDDGELVVSFSNGTDRNVGVVVGEDGVSVVNAEINASYELIITLSNDTVMNLGSIKSDYVARADHATSADRADHATSADIVNYITPSVYGDSSVKFRYKKDAIKREVYIGEWVGNDPLLAGIAKYSFVDSNAYFKVGDQFSYNGDIATILSITTISVSVGGAIASASGQKILVEHVGTARDKEIPVENATNAENATKVNGFTVEKDSNNSIVIDGTILSYRKLVFQGTQKLSENSRFTWDIDENYQKLLIVCKGSSNYGGGPGRGFCFPVYRNRLAEDSDTFAPILAYGSWMNINDVQTYPIYRLKHSDATDYNIDISDILESIDGGKTWESLQGATVTEIWLER